MLDLSRVVGDLRRKRRAAVLAVGRDRVDDVHDGPATTRGRSGGDDRPAPRRGLRRRGPAADRQRGERADERETRHARAGRLKLKRLSVPERSRPMFARWSRTTADRGERRRTRSPATASRAARRRAAASAPRRSRRPTRSASAGNTTSQSRAPIAPTSGATRGSAAGRRDDLAAALEAEEERPPMAGHRGAAGEHAGRSPRRERRRTPARSPSRRRAHAGIP